MCIWSWYFECGFDETKDLFGVWMVYGKRLIQQKSPRVGHGVTVIGVVGMIEGMISPEDAIALVSQKRGSVHGLDHSWHIPGFDRDRSEQSLVGQCWRLSLRTLVMPFVYHVIRTRQAEVYTKDSKGNKLKSGKSPGALAPPFLRILSFLTAFHAGF